VGSRKRGRIRLTQTLAEILSTTYMRPLVRPSTAWLVAPKKWGILSITAGKRASGGRKEVRIGTSNDSASVGRAWAKDTRQKGNKDCNEEEF